MAFSLFTDLSEEFVAKLGNNLFSSISNFISGISPLFAAGFGIYICIVALNAYNRGLDENIMDLGKRILGWLIIIAAAFNASQYIDIANMVYSTPETLASLFGKGDFGPSAFDASAQKLDELLDKISTLASSKSGLKGLALNLSVTLKIWLPVFICGNLMLGMSFAYYVVTKICLALTIMIGPLFIGMMLFPATRQYGMNWIGQCLNYSVTVVMFSVLGMVQTSYFDQQIDKYMTGDIATDLVMAEGLPAIFILSTLFFVLAAIKIPGIASALTGGASLEGFSAGLVRSAAQTNMLSRMAGRLGGLLKRGSGGSIRKG
jgi:trbL/virB6 plasmid conjugal transfer protein